MLYELTPKPVCTSHEPLASAVIQYLGLYQPLFKTFNYHKTFSEGGNLTVENGLRDLTKLTKGAWPAPLINNDVAIATAEEVRAILNPDHLPAIHPNLSPLLGTQ